MKREPAERYPSAGEFADDVRRYLAHEEVSVGKNRLFSGFFPRAWRDRRLQVGGAIVAVVIGGASFRGGEGRPKKSGPSTCASAGSAAHVRLTLDCWGM